jgi:hypothetical protein
MVGGLTMLAEHYCDQCVNFETNTCDMPCYECTVIHKDGIDDYFKSKYDEEE